VLLELGEVRPLVATAVALEEVAAGHIKNLKVVVFLFTQVLEAAVEESFQALVDLEVLLAQVAAITLGVLAVQPMAQVQQVQVVAAVVAAAGVLLVAVVAVLAAEQFC
jgi:hypothetical protein